MKSTEVRAKSNEELSTLEGELRRQLWKVRFDNQANQLDDSSQIKKLRRDIARVRTVLTERAKKA